MTRPIPASPPLDARSLHLRALAMRGLLAADRGHVGSTLSLIEILRVLYDRIMRHDPAHPEWPDRDRFILSKGHGCLALYAILADHGYFPPADLDTFCRKDSPFGGHPPCHGIPGVEAATGALGHGLSLGIGRARALKLAGSTSRVFVVCGDGEINEGAIWEGAMSAGRTGLDNLWVLIDYNKVQSYGPTAEVLDLEPLADKWASFGFTVDEVDGHDCAALEQVLSRPPNIGRPSALICHTVKGRGLAEAEADPTAWHHKSRLGEAREVIEAAFAAAPPQGAP
ncbi:transketolase [Roseospirillum parvum]|uniref:Transketolase n=1 Tax=Roseospirillum parvum TaxID=83401 RepID=A0A1G7TUT3_9PROT|nr:transketolase [Roseospirillum parvum]SDG38784.1 transketolase [Roseospirillum parvum]